MRRCSIKVERKRAAMLISSLISIALSFISGMPAQAASDLDSRLLKASEAYKSNNFSKAERLYKKLQLELSKENASDERLPQVLEGLADAYAGQKKYDAAEESYQSQLDMLKKLGKDSSGVEQKLSELHDSYRRIDIDALGESAHAIALEFGASKASAKRQAQVKSDTQKDPLSKSEERDAAGTGDAAKDESTAHGDQHSIEIVLQRRFQKGVKDIVSALFPEKSAAIEKFQKESSLDETNSENDSAGSDRTAAKAGKKEGKREPKRLRLDKNISFNMSQAQDGSLLLSNIEGIFVDVGLWVKLKGLLMPQENTESPSVELTAGAFGVEKKVKAAVPRDLLQKLREGFCKFDPFLAAPAQAASIEKQ